MGHLNTNALLVLTTTGALLTGLGAAAATDPGAEMMRQGDLLIAESHYLEAADMYARAGKSLGEAAFGDDAEFSHILALEAAGEDETATKLWKRWIGEFGTSPLAAEAELARTWNLVRRGQTTTARETLRELTETSPWLLRDGRVRTLAAAIDYADGRFAQALSWLTAAPDTRATSTAGAHTRPALGFLLEGLCQEKAGAEYPAIIAYQSLLDQYPDSPLRGYAHLAKGRIFSLSEDYRDAAREFEKLAGTGIREDLRAESRFLAAACRFLSGDVGGGINSMAAVSKAYAGQDMAARALFALGEMRWRMNDYELAITRFNQVLAGYFANDLAGSALYRTGRCLDALGRTREANSAYQAVADGYPYAPEAPAAVYLAGVGLLEQGLPRDAAPYFQLVLDRYAGSGAAFVFESPEHQELVEASLCLLEYSHYQSGELGLMAGAPHRALEKMPSSGSLWRAYTLLLDADALSAQARFPEAQASLDRLLAEFPDHPVGIRANRLLAWTYARQGRQDLAIETEQRMLARYAAQSDETNLSAARLTMAHSRFNTKNYAEAADEYAEFLRLYPSHPGVSEALYQQGLCFQMMGQDGDAVDAWTRITEIDPASPEAEKAWLRSGDVYFQAAHFPEARRCFSALMKNFPADDSQATALLRLGRCDYNEGKGAEALARFRTLRTGFPNSPESQEVQQDLTQVLYGMGREGDPACLVELARDFPDSPLAPEARFELAMAQYDRGDYSTAGRLFSELAGRYPQYSGADRATFLATDAQEKAGDRDAARAGWQRFQEYFPTSDLAATARFRAASLRFQDGEFVQASKDFQAVLEQPAGDEIHSAALYNLALCRRILGDDEAARRALADYRSRDYPAQERDVQVARVLGEIHEQAGHFAAAAAEYQRAVELGATGPEAIELNYLAGVCLDRAGDRAGALGSYELSIAGNDKANTFRLSALAQIAALQEEDGEFGRALAAYRDLINNASDPTLVGAATERAQQLEAALGR